MTPTPAAITLHDDTGAVLGTVTRTERRWTPTCAACEAPGLRAVGYPATAVQMLLVHLERVCKGAAA